MNKHEIEARLERSLARQIVAPRLDRRFDSAVWARIEAEEARAADSVFEKARAPRASRWLFISNLVGAAVALVLVANFGWRALAGSGLDLEVSASVSLPVSDTITTGLMVAGGYIITAIVLVFGLSLTSYGRRLRAELF